MLLKLLHYLLKGENGLRRKSRRRRHASHTQGVKGVRRYRRTGSFVRKKDKCVICLDQLINMKTGVMVIWLDFRWTGTLKLKLTTELLELVGKVELCLTKPTLGVRQLNSLTNDTCRNRK